MTSVKKMVHKVIYNKGQPPIGVKETSRLVKDLATAGSVWQEHKGDATASGFCSRHQKDYLKQNVLFSTSYAPFYLRNKGHYFFQINISRNYRGNKRGRCIVYQFRELSL